MWQKTSVKYTIHSTEDGFERQCGRLGWVQRFGFYRRGMGALGRPAEGSIIIDVENQAPNNCGTFVLDEGDIAAFGGRIDGILKAYERCQYTGLWPGYPQVLTPLKLAKWDLPYEAPTNEFGGET